MATEKIKERLVQDGENVAHEMTDAAGNTTSVSFSPEQFRQMLTEIGRELRKPDDDVLEAKAEAEKRRQLNMKQMIELARIETDNRNKQQSRCGHKKEDGRTLWYGQIHSDGKYHPICLRCQLLGTPQDPPRELLAQGIG